jgi:hypothetical protein
MKKALHITATIDQPEFLEDLVEKLAYRHNDIGYGKQRMPVNHEALETSSTDTYISGTMAMDDSGEHVDVPFITRFVFTCIKGKDSGYKLEWSSSLS